MIDKDEAKQRGEALAERLKGEDPIATVAEDVASYIEQLEGDAFTAYLTALTSSIAPTPSSAGVQTPGVVRMGELNVILAKDPRFIVTLTKYHTWRRAGGGAEKAP